MPYQPASMISSDANLQHISNNIYYDKKSVENLKAHLPFYMITGKRKLPENSGKTIQLFEYNLFSANTTPGVEGTVGAGISLGTVRNQATIQQYTDYMSFSDMLLETAIDPILENSATELGYRAGLTVNKLISTQFDTLSTGAAVIDLADDEFFNAGHVRQGVMSLRAANVKPFESNKFVGVLHPFQAFDLVNDNTAGGYIDLNKRSDKGQAELQRGIQGYDVWEHFQSRWVESTTVPTSANFPVSGETGYHSYLVGADALIVVSLGATEIPKDANYKVNVQRYSGPSVADPAGVIKGTISYNFKFAMDSAPDAIPRFRRFRCETSITA